VLRSFFKAKKQAVFFSVGGVFFRRTDVLFVARKKIFMLLCSGFPAVAGVFSAPVPGPSRQRFLYGILLVRRTTWKMKVC